MTHPVGSDGLPVGPEATLAWLIAKKHQPLWLSNQDDRCGLAGDCDFVGGEVKCKGAIMPGVGPWARNRERGPGVALAPPSFVHPQRANITSSGRPFDSAQESANARGFSSRLRAPGRVGPRKLAANPARR